MKLRFPKRGFRTRRFNNNEQLEKVNLGKLAEFIEKGFISVKEPITIKTMYESGLVSKVNAGIKLLGRGAERF